MNYERMIKLLAGNLAENAIPTFKKNKGKSYFKMMKFIAQNELTNSLDGSKIW